ncbi:MAG: hypothetical protein US97_C0029G0003 [Microgenomates group bacterium GW2011_GWF1_38_5]|nr:MAG: hypothetical protein US97_C0029G0003 [Microgenomates group bacterium GW2011_GWF1_38_5]
MVKTKSKNSNNSIEKTIKNNESGISMIIGAIVIVIVGLFIIKNYSPTEEGEVVPSIGTEEDSISDKYTVQKGDDLWNISENYYGSGYDWTLISEANDIQEPYILEEGQELVIPEKESIPETETESDDISSTPEQVLPTLSAAPSQNEEVSDGDENGVSQETYTVAKGDSLWNISVKLYGDGYKWTEIANANGLKNPNLIHSGNVFVIPR